MFVTVAKKILKKLEPATDLHHRHSCSKSCVLAGLTLRWPRGQRSVLSRFGMAVALWLLLSGCCGAIRAVTGPRFAISPPREMQCCGYGSLGYALYAASLAVRGDAIANDHGTSKFCIS